MCLARKHLIWFALSFRALRRCPRGVLKVKSPNLYLDHIFVCKACALVHDLNILEDGDESEVGEHGVSGVYSRSFLLRPQTFCM